MSSVERDLVSKILHTRDLSDVVEAGITPKFFLESDHRDAYQLILEHQSEYSVVPTLDTFRLDYPTYRITDAEEPTAFYIDELKGHYTDFLVETGLAKAFDHYDLEGDTQAAIRCLTDMLQDLNADVSSARVTDLTQTGNTRFERYLAYTKHEGSLRGIPTGFPTLDTVTLGWQPGQLTTFVGPPKAGKSTLALLSDMAAHRAAYVPCFMGFEMANEEQEERYDAIRANVSHRDLRAGTLSREHMEKIRQTMMRDKSMPPLIFTEDAGSLTVSGVASYINRFKPDVAFIDGVYMMEDEHGERKGSPQALTNITRSLKQLAKNTKISIVITTQVLEWKMSQKKGVTTQSIGYSSSFLQDSDHIIAVETTDDEDINKLKYLAGRSAPGREWFMLWDWDNAKFEELEDPNGGSYVDTPVTF